jgi:RNA polymerase sigma factor (sigma-70 family)
MHQHVEDDGEGQKAMAEILFHRHAAAIFAFLRQQSPSREDAEDLLLEVFSAALEQPNLSSLAPKQQLALLWTIVRNKQISAYRLRKRRPSVSMELLLEDLFADTGQTPEHEIVRLEEYARLHSAIQMLPPLQQKVLQLRFIHDLRSPQIATQIGKSETAVRSMISRTLNQLRKLYKEGEK